MWVFIESNKIVFTCTCTCMNSRVLITLADNSKVGVKLGIKYANVFLKVVVKATYICPNGVRNRRVPLYIYII